MIYVKEYVRHLPRQIGDIVPGPTDPFFSCMQVIEINGAQAKSLRLGLLRGG